MKITRLIDTLHNTYQHAKYGFLAVFCLSFLLLVTLSQQARGESVVSSVDTKVTFTANSKTVIFVTKENTLANALSAEGITLNKNDITEPPLSTPLIGEDIQARLIPAIPVLINDNGQSWVGQSAYSDTMEILNQLGVQVDKADNLTRELILDPVTENLVGQRISIERAPVYTVSVDGNDVIVHSWSKTVSEVLAEGGITLNQNDTVSPSKDEIVPTSGQIIVTRINYADIEETVSIPYETQNKSSYDLYEGQSKVVQGGINGSKKQSIHIVYHNGVEISREVTSATVVESPQTKIVQVGVKPYGIDDLWPILVAASNKYSSQSIYDISPEKMARVMNCESHYNVRAYNPDGYYGLFQWDGSLYTWSADAGHPASNMFDVYAQIYATALRASQNDWTAWGQCQNR